MRQMHETTAPSGVKVFSEVPFRPYNAWDHNWVLFQLKCRKFTATKIAKAYRAYLRGEFR